MALDISEEPEQIAKGWAKDFYAQPPDLVLNEDTGFPAAMPGSAAALIQDEVPTEPAPSDDWRQAVKEWFDGLP